MGCKLSVLHSSISYFLYQNCTKAKIASNHSSSISRSYPLVNPVMPHDESVWRGGFVSWPWSMCYLEVLAVSPHPRERWVTLGFCWIYFSPLWVCDPDDSYIVSVSQYLYDIYDFCRSYADYHDSVQGFQRTKQTKDMAHDDIPVTQRRIITRRVIEGVGVCIEFAKQSKK